MDGRALTVKELARRWDCAEMTIRRLVWAGELRAFRIGTRGVRIPLSEAERWEREHEAGRGREEAVNR